MSGDPQYDARDRAALRLYAAYLDISADRLPWMFKQRYPLATLENWRRVADEAAGVRVPRIEPPRPPRAAPKPKVIPAKTQQSRGTVEIVAPALPAVSAKVFCEQCDRLVDQTKAATCASRFCKAKAA